MFTFRRKLLLQTLLTVGAFLLPETHALASPLPCQIKDIKKPIPSIDLNTLTVNLKSPVGVTHGGDGSKRLFFIEQEGKILLWKNGKISPSVFLDIQKRVISGGERGLLGLAFHPRFSENQKFYVNYTARNKGLQTVISEFRVSNQKDQADPSSEKILLTIPQPYGNHNGGNIAFGPDGYLYIGMGDGGAANDPENHGQDLTSLLGKMLRINVDTPSKTNPYSIPADNPFINQKNVRKEIWAYGLRNPWRFSFDSLTGFLYAGDVGQNAREEIDIVEKGKNYGWNIMEGTICTRRGNRNCKKQGLALPILDYPHSQGTTVIGGYVYRGNKIPGLCGVYLYADFGNGKIFGLKFDGKKVVQSQILLESKRQISSFGEDEDRELYITDITGEVLQIVASSPSKQPKKRGWFPFFK